MVVVVSLYRTIKKPISMKLFIALFSLVVLSTSSIGDNLKSSENDVITYEVVFDGNEGGMHFFTDSKNEAITVEDEESKLFEKFSQDANSYVGRTFTILFKATDADSDVYTVTSVIELELK